jgi:aspartate racemase
MKVSHHYYPRLEKSLTSAKMFHIVKETADNVSSTHPGLKNVGVLATEGTLKTGIWQDELHRRGINTVVLPNRFQNILTTSYTG